METKALVPLDDGGIIPLEPKDAATLIIVGRVFDWMAETGDWNLTRSFRETGVSYWSFYRAFKRPVVQAMVAQRLMGLQVATLAILDEYWLEVIFNMIEIATGVRGNNRAAVQAARFLFGVRNSAAEQIRQEGKAEQGVSQARLILHAMSSEQYPLPAGAKVHARRKTVTEELEVLPDDGSGVIEG